MLFFVVDGDGCGLRSVEADVDGEHEVVEFERDASDGSVFIGFEFCDGDPGLGAGPFAFCLTPFRVGFAFGGCGEVVLESDLFWLGEQGCGRFWGGEGHAVGDADGEEGGEKREGCGLRVHGRENPGKVSELRRLANGRLKVLWGRRLSGDDWGKSRGGRCLAWMMFQRVMKTL